MYDLHYRVRYVGEPSCSTEDGQPLFAFVSRMKLRPNQGKADGSEILSRLRLLEEVMKRS